MRFVALLLLGVLLGIGGYLFLIDAKKTPLPPQVKLAPIGGSININGVIPDNGSVVFLRKEANTTEKFEQFETHPAVLDDKQWTFDKAILGKSYEIKALVRVGKKTLAQSSPIFVTAPAQDEMLNIDIPLLPNITPAEVSISGTVGINGYIPDGATIIMESRIAQTSDFAAVAQNIPAKDEQSITYTSALSGKNYEARIVLVDKGKQQIGSSKTLSVTAPADSERWDINSTAKPSVTPLPFGVISGIINFNGQAPPNSRIVVFQKKADAPNYQVAVGNINAADGTKWIWNKASSSASYDLIVTLKQKQSDGTDKDIVNSNTLTLTAPAANEIFTINFGQ